MGEESVAKLTTENLTRLRRNQIKGIERSPSDISPVSGETFYETCQELFKKIFHAA